MVFLNLNQTGRNAPEWVDGINRNQWTECSGMGGRNGPEYANWSDLMNKALFAAITCRLALVLCKDQLFEEYEVYKML